MPSVMLFIIFSHTGACEVNDIATLKQYSYNYISTRLQAAHSGSPHNAQRSL